MREVGSEGGRWGVREGGRGERRYSGGKGERGTQQGKADGSGFSLSVAAISIL